MGVFSVRIEVGSPIDPVFSEMDLLVDTGADFSMLPTSLLEGALGLSPTEGDRETFELADGSKREYSIGEVRFRYGDRERTTPVVFGPENVYILGAVSLQSLGLIADTTRHTLIPSPRFHLGFQTIVRVSGNSLIRTGSRAIGHIFP